MLDTNPTSFIVTCLTTRLSSGSPGLKVKFLTSVLQFLHSLLGPAGQIDVDGGPHASPEVGGAGMDVAVLWVQHEVSTRLRLDRVSHSLDTPGKAIKHSPDISTALHGDDPQLILLIDPGQERLVLVVENTPTLWPVSLHTSNLSSVRWKLVWLN